MKSDRNISNKGLLSNHTAVSPEEILAAGGATAFGLKSGKNRDALKKALQNAPQPEPFTQDEWENLLIQLEKDK